jgi:geranylgeranyl diphosphate synthase type II
MTASDAEYVRSVLVSCGAKDYAITLATENALLAVMHLDSEGVPDVLRKTLERMLFAVISDLSSR